MNRSFATETWRAVKFLLISSAVSLLMALVYRAAMHALLAANLSQPGLWLSVLSYAYTFFNVSISTLLNRYFTFRATEKWYIALPLMLAAAFGWNLLTGTALTLMASRADDTIISQISTLLSILWIAAAYLLQRCAIYCHTTDTNKWYTRFHMGDEQQGDDDNE